MPKGLKGGRTEKSSPRFDIFRLSSVPLPKSAKVKVARHSTALVGRRHRCYLPVLAGFTRLPMHGTWPRRNVGRTSKRATKIRFEDKTWLCGPKNTGRWPSQRRYSRRQPLFRPSRRKTNLATGMTGNPAITPGFPVWRLAAAAAVVAAVRPQACPPAHAADRPDSGFSSPVPSSPESVSHTWGAAPASGFR